MSKYTYQTPGKWTAGMTVSEGDVFQVNDNDKKTNTSLTVGDFYIVRNGGDIQPYPANGQSNADWMYEPRAWAGVSKISLNTDAGTTATIVANGMQMARVYVHMNPTDQGGQDISVDPDALMNATQLVNYQTGKPLTLIPTPTPQNPTTQQGWLYCTKPNDYVTSQAVSGNTTAMQVLELFVLCNNPDSNNLLNIGATVRPTRGEKVEDTMDDSGVIHSSVTVTAKPVPGFTRMTHGGK